MKRYELIKVSGKPNFNLFPIMNIDVPYADTPSNIGATAQICYSDNALFVRLQTTESNALAEEHGLLGYPCRDSCLEFFLCFRKSLFFVYCDSNFEG